MASICRIACCQILSGADKLANIATALKAIETAAGNKANIIALPECFNSPYGTSEFPKYAEPIPATRADIDPEVHITTHALAEAASAHKVFVVGGSIPERAENGALYNTCCVFSPGGEIIAKHRKMHLFDIDIPGKITFKESETLSAGNELAYFDTPYGRVGLGICYDMRFPQLAQLLCAAGAKLLVYPGAFNTTTGPAHWELLQRARALDNQLYFATVSPARNPESSYQAWGHSTVCSPWGEVLATTDEGPGIVYADLDMDRVDAIRQQIPVGVQQRTDLYELQWKGDRR